MEATSNITGATKNWTHW